ncbi:GNAT family N-acetyltransferase [Paenibacillus sp. GCM10027627]|uniref:GNAT family N-acetyltransferase n=1 Tax=unclassified Paenibacillus TaxID=185978 RepID=UPI0036366C3E
MGHVRLVKPAAEYRQSYTAFYEDWKSTGEGIVPWVVQRDPGDFEAYLDFLYGFDTEEKAALSENGFVPNSTYWLLDGEDQVVGAVNIRHRLNEKLLESGGHIGYGISPSHRRKGYARAQLALALNIVKEMGLKRVLLVCNKTNEASERTIRGAGGQFESMATSDDGEELLRFWIELDEK